MKRAVEALVLIVLCFATPAAADELTGRELLPIEQLETAIASGLTDLIFGDGGAEGTIETITVISSSERQLDLKIEFSGLRNRDLIVRAGTSGGNIQSEVTRAAQRIEDGMRSVELNLELDPGLAEGFTLVSPTLIVTIQRPDGIEVRKQLFALNKTWSMAIAPENLVVSYRAEPIGQAQALLRKIRTPSSNSTNQVPTRIVKPNVGDTITLDPKQISLNSRTAAALQAAKTPQVAELQRAPTSIKLDPNVAARLYRPSQTVTMPQTARAAETSSPQTVTMSPSVAAYSTATTNPAVLNALKESNQTLVTAVPVNQMRLTDYARFKFAEPKPEEAEQPASTNPTNMVANSAPPVFDMVRTEPGISINLADVLGIERAIFPDQNPRSGIFYYIPRIYRLAYDREIGGAQGLALRIDYATLAEPGATDNAVSVAMTLQAPLDGNSIAVAWELVKAYAEAQDDVPFSELRPLPIASVPAFDFTDSLAGAVDPEQIAVIAFSDFLEGLQVIWRTDPVRAENIRRQLSDVTMGITGRALFPVPATTAGTVREIPARVELSDPEVFDAVAFSRSEPMRNVSPLPIRLKHLHALVLSADGGPRVYSWSLGDQLVPAAAQIDLDLTDFPAELDDIADRIWIDYRLDPDCGDCVRDIVEEVLRGGVWPDTSAVTVAPLPSLFEDGVAEIRMDIRSRFLDPTDRTLADAPPLYLRASDDSKSIEPIFMADRQSPDSDEEWPLMEYKLSVTRESGEVIEGQTWLSASATRITPGSFQLTQSLAATSNTEGAE